MQRNFMGLNPKDSVLKKEAVEGSIEPESVPVMMNNPTSQLVFPWYGVSVPAQLTIFYDGMVNVYDDVSPEKAQAIMFLAGNRNFVAMGDAPQPRTQAHGPAPMAPNSTQPCSPVSSPISVSSHQVDQLTGVPPNETEAAKRILSSLGQAMQLALPQARKASLARFLEKRRERVMASAPYSHNKNTMDNASNNNAAVVAGE